MWYKQHRLRRITFYRCVNVKCKFVNDGIQNDSIGTVLWYVSTIMPKIRFRDMNDRDDDVIHLLQYLPENSKIQQITKSK